MEVHYQNTFFKQHDLRQAAKRYLARLPKDINVLVSTGSSGCAIATAMVTLADRPLRHVFIRKTYEMKTHGNRFVGYEYGMEEGCKFAVVDDFIHTGRTIKRLLRQCPERFTFHTILVGYAGGFNDNGVIKELEKKYHLNIIIVD